jgi:hypothetical protein
VAKGKKERRKLTFKEKLMRLQHDAMVEGRYETASLLLDIVKKMDTIPNEPIIEREAKTDGE